MRRGRVLPRELRSRPCGLGIESFFLPQWAGMGLYRASLGGRSLMRSWRDQRSGISRCRRMERDEKSSKEKRTGGVRRREAVTGERIACLAGRGYAVSLGPGAEPSDMRRDGNAPRGPSRNWRDSSSVKSWEGLTSDAARGSERCRR
jgi:hypothetical protein